MLPQSLCEGTTKPGPELPGPKPSASIQRKGSVMSTNTTSRNTRLSQAEKLSDGMGKHENVITSLVIDGQPYAAKDIVAVLQEIITSETNAVTTRAEWRAAVAADKAERAKRKVFLSGLKQALRVAFGGQIDVLTDFGLAPRKPRKVLTPQEKAAAAAKAKATRAARHTMGAKQKAKIKGTEPQGANPPAATPPAPPATPAAPPSPPANEPPPAAAPKS